MTDLITASVPSTEIRGAWSWTAILSAHAFAAGFWWWGMPRGFPVSHPRFWVNEVLPPIAIALAIIGMIGFVRRWLTLASAVCLAITIFWLSLLVAAGIIFPASRSRLLPPIAVVAGALAADYWFRAPCTRLRPLVAVPVAMAAGLVGATVLLAERAPAASTFPHGGELPTVEAKNTSPPPGSVVQIGQDLRADSTTGTVFARCGHLFLEIEPLLSFESCSPDRCWTIFAPPGERTLPARTLVAWTLDQAKSQALFSIAGDNRHALKVTGGPGSGVAIDAWTTLDAPLYSHLNSCCQLVISGHRHLALAFSPCPEMIVEVEPADYPVGRPARFAYLDAGEVFHVVEATSGEKGPFRELGSGALHRDQVNPLEVSFYDEGRVVGSLAIGNWSRQVSTELSPTAGWGVPMNAIEFRRLGDIPSAPVAIWFTLAGTSVGRGWDSVGHRAGTYSTQLVISPSRTRAR